MKLRWRIAQFFEMHWWRHYLSGKDKAAYLKWKKAYWHSLLRQVGWHIPDGARVLDAGCGPAGIFTVLEGKEVEALDPLLDEYEKSLMHFQRNDYPWVRFFTIPLEDFKTDKPFEYVFCLNAINHVASLDASLKSLAGCLQPGGHMLLTVDAHNFSFLRQIFQWIPGDILHPHQYELAAYVSMLEQIGLRVERSVLIKKELIFSYYALLVIK